MSSEAIFILGMHRSGTSALTRVLNLVGVGLGDSLMTPKPDNKKGFWEDNDIVAQNELLLSSLGSSWFDTKSLHFDLVAQENFATLSEILDGFIHENKLWGIKDPRICRLLPIYLSLLNQKEVKTKAVIIFRDPFEVALSLQKRNGFQTITSLLLWLVYILDSELNSRDLPRVWVSYETLINDWQGVVEKVGSQLNIEWPTDVAKATNEVELFLDKSLWHNKKTLIEEEKLPKFILDLVADTFSYLKECERIQLHETKTAFDGLRDRYSDIQSLLEACGSAKSEETSYLRQENENLKRENIASKEHVKKVEENIEKNEQTIRELESQLTEIVTSNSWRVTRPMRLLSRLIQTKT